MSVAVAGLVISAGFRLIAMSYKLMAELMAERELAAAAEEIWMRFRVDKDMPDNGTDDKKGITWQATHESVPVDEYELQFRRVTIRLRDGRSTTIYVDE